MRHVALLLYLFSLESKLMYILDDARIESEYRSHAGVEVVADLELFIGCLLVSRHRIDGQVVVIVVRSTVCGTAGWGRSADG